MSLTPYKPPDFDLLGQLEASFNQKQVDIITFAESPEFCGRVLYPRQRLLLKLFFLEELTDEEEAILDEWIHGGRNGSEITISPLVRERIADLKSRGFKHFREIVLVGGRRCSKGFITGMSLAKLVWDLIALQDPGNYYGIDPDKEIVFGCVAASQDQAKQMQYADFSAMVNSCKAMQRNIFKVQELEFSLMTESDIRKVESWKRQNRRVQKDISKVRGRALPANSRTIRGLTAMAMVFDEFAHFQQGESDQSDKEVYSAAQPALAQFALDAMIFNNSSPFSKVGMLYERFEAAMSIDNDKPEFPEMLALQFPSWALYEGWWEDPTYIGPKKCITVSPDWDYDRRTEDGGLFYTEADRHAIIIERQMEKDDAVKYKVERRGKFAETVDAYLIPEMVDRMFLGRPVAYDQGANNWTYETIRTNWDESTYMLKYYAHLDPSSTTAGFGFALGHVEEFTQGQRTEQHVVFDIIKRWDPRDFKDHTIDWEPILEWITNICYLFRPQQLTMDQYNSSYPITWLRRKFREKRIETRVFEKTATSQTNWDRAEIFRTALYRGLIHAPSDTPDCVYCGEELKFLQEIKTSRVPRVEKQDTGPIQTKDLADCVMTVTEVTIGDLMAVQLRQDLSGERVLSGAPGGYSLGGDELQRGARGTPFADFYTSRRGEQMLPINIKRDRKPDPSRRVAGGRPIPRRLPGW